MKRKFLLLPALALCSLMFISCDKDDSNNNNQLDTRVRTLIEDYSAVPFGGIDTLDMTYDGSNRIATISERSGTFAMNYSYTGSSSYIMTMTETGTPTLWEKFMSNGMGLIDSTIQSETPGDSLTEKYYYNASSQLIEMRSYNYGSGSSSLEEITRYQYDGNGNKTKEILLDAMGDTVQVMTTTYNTVVPAWYTVGIQFMPVAQRNLPISNSIYDAASGETELIEITYLMDSNNRISKETYSSTFGDYTKTYLYF